MVFIAVINLLGIRPFAALEIFLTFAVAGSLLVVGVVGLAGAGTTDPIGSALPDIDLTWSLLSALLGLAIFTFVGVEYTCPLAEELKRPSRDIPLGIFLGLALIAVPVVLYGLARGALRAGRRARDAGADDPGRRRRRHLRRRGQMVDGHHRHLRVDRDAQCGCRGRSSDPLRHGPDEAAAVTLRVADPGDPRPVGGDRRHRGHPGPS